MANKGNAYTSPHSKMVLDNTVEAASDTPYPISFTGDAQTGIFYRGASKFGLGAGGSEAANVSGPIFTVSGWLAGSVSAALSAQGLASIGGALALVSQYNFVESATSAQGVVLPASAVTGVGSSVAIFNSSLNNITVYGNGADTIDGVAATTGVTISLGKRCEFILKAAATWISAQWGATSA